MRWRPQFHLSTAWLMMCAAALLVWLNARERSEQTGGERYCSMFKELVYRTPEGETRTMKDPSPRSDGRDYFSIRNGFPFTFRTNEKIMTHFIAGNPSREYSEEHESHPTLNLLNLATDTVVLAICLLVVAVASEFVIRRTHPITSSSLPDAS